MVSTIFTDSPGFRVTCTLNKRLELHIHVSYFPLVPNQCLSWIKTGTVDRPIITKARTVGIYEAFPFFSDAPCPFSLQDITDSDSQEFGTSYDASLREPYLPHGRFTECT